MIVKKTRLVATAGIAVLVISSWSAGAQDIQIDEVGDRRFRIKDKKDTIEGLAHYGAALFRSIEQLSSDYQDLNQLTYHAKGLNAFEYNPAYGMQWAPPISSDLPQPSPTFVMAMKIDSANASSRFAWLQPQFGGEIPPKYHWTVPDRVAESLPPPNGFEWKKGRVNRVPEDYIWYLPQTWSDQPPVKITWEQAALTYRLTVEDEFLDEYRSLSDRGKAQMLSDLLSISVVSTQPWELLSDR